MPKISIIIPVYNEKFEAGVKKLKEFQIPYTFMISYSNWIKMYNQVDGKPYPFQSDPQKAWDNCCAKAYCLTIMNNELFKCAALANYYRMATEHKLPDEWNVVLTHQPATASYTKRHIMRYVNSGMMKECCVCPEKHEHIPVCEISSSFHKIVEKKRIRDRLEK